MTGNGATCGCEICPLHEYSAGSLFCTICRRMRCGARQELERELRKPAQDQDEARLLYFTEVLSGRPGKGSRNAAN